MSIDAKRRLAAAAFIALLILSVFWPSPVVAVNALCCHAQLGVDDLSFLGREAPRWDAIFWCIAGVFAAAILLPRTYDKRDFAEPWHMLRRMRVRVGVTPIVALVASAIAVALIWRFADMPVTAWADRIQSDDVQDTIRYANRFGGGMNPPMVILFFYLAGVAYRCRRWIAYALAMTLAGAGAGLLVQATKLLVSRARPELWLGAFERVRSSASSFPSGHTVGAFAFAGVLMLISPSRTMRVVAFLLAVAVGFSRILAFRHWTSDVVASAAAGMLAAWIICRSVSQLTRAEEVTH